MTCVVPYARVARVASIGAALLLAAPGAAAQNPPGRAVPDTLRAKTDSLARLDSLRLAAPDSVMRALMERRGYIVTRYQGDSVKFNAGDNGLLIYGKPTLVERGQMRVAGDSIAYSNARGQIRIAGSPGIVHDPARGEDIIAFAPINYFLNERRGSACEIQTEASTQSVWYLRAECGAFVSDTSGAVFLGRNVSLTTDSSDTPHYHFEIGELKKYGRNTIVGSPAKLYIGEVPVLWLPWFWQPTKRGRSSGFLTPRFGFAELVRNSARYRRTVENVGFYWAASDYYDGSVAMDWRSGARPRENDAGFIRLNGEVRYRWRDRFLSGRLGAERLFAYDGNNNLTLSLAHDQRFSQRTNLNVNFNYVTSTQVRQQTTINPYLAVATIVSQAAFATELGPFRTSIGGTQRQFPGRDELTRDFPSLSITSKPISLASWLTWTPTLSTTNQQTFHLDSPSEFAFRRFLNEAGQADSVPLDRNTRTTSAQFSTPFKVGSFTISASARVSDRENDFPEAKLVVNPVDTSLKRTIVYARTYLTTFDWDVGMNLPQFFQGSWNLTPSISLRNVDPGAYMVRSERTGAEYVTQSKRGVYGLAISPTFFARTGGIGPFAAIRHSVSPIVTYNYSPEATVSDAYLAAIGRVRPGYLGALAQNRISLSLNQVFEAKYRARPSDSATAAGAAEAERKIRLLALTFSAIEYDFELARATGRSGIATDNFNIGLRSDLLPGLTLGADYSLFDAPVISDTANFDPYLEGITASLSLGRGAGGLGVLGRLVRWATGERAAPPPSGSDTARVGIGAGPPGVSAPQGQFPAGRSYPSLVDLPTSQGWQANISLTSRNPRPPRGANVIDADPTARCEIFRETNPAQYAICFRQATPTNVDYSQTETTGGGVVFRYPPTRSMSGSMTIPLTENWAAQWQTSYDLVRGEFASQVVTLQRNLKDWRALFGFTQAPNGNFAFTFLVALKPAPDIKFDYYRPGYGVPSGPTGSVTR